MKQKESPQSGPPSPLLEPIPASYFVEGPDPVRPQDDSQLEAMFSRLLDDLDMHGDKRKPLDSRTNEQKWNFILLQRARNATTPSPTYLIALLRRFVTAQQLDSIAVHLSTAPISWSSMFFKAGGHLYLLSILAQLSSRLSGFEPITESEANILTSDLVCLREICNNTEGISLVTALPDSLMTVVNSLCTSAPRTIDLVLQILLIFIYSSPSASPHFSSSTIKEILSGFRNLRRGSRGWKILADFVSPSRPSTLRSIVLFMRALWGAMADMPSFRYDWLLDIQSAGLLAALRTLSMDATPALEGLMLAVDTELYELGALFPSKVVNPFNREAVAKALEFNQKATGLSKSLNLSLIDISQRDQSLFSRTMTLFNNILTILRSDLSKSRAPNLNEAIESAATIDELLTVNFEKDCYFKEQLAVTSGFCPTNQLDGVDELVKKGRTKGRDRESLLKEAEAQIEGLKQSAKYISELKEKEKEKAEESERINEKLKKENSELRKEEEELTKSSKQKEILIEKLSYELSKINEEKGSPKKSTIIEAKVNSEDSKKISELEAEIKQLKCELSNQKKASQQTELNTPLPPPPPPPPPIDGVPPPPPPPPPMDGVPPPPPPPPMDGIPPPPPPPPIGGMQISIDQKPKGPPPKVNKPPPAKVKQIFWSKISDASTQSTIWSSISDSDVNLNEQSLITLFSSVEPPKPKQQVAATPKQKVVEIIDQNRSKSVSIMLGRLRRPFETIVQQIKHLDTSLTDEEIASLKGNIPTKEEIQSIEAFEGDRSQLDGPEKFFLALKEVKMLPSHIDFLSLRCGFKEQIEDIENTLNILKSGTEVLANSKGLKELLSYMLKIGNFLNGGTQRGGAYGFRVEFLSKLNEVRTSKPGYTLLNFVCEELQCNDLATEMSQVKKCLGVDLETAKEGAKKLNGMMKKLEAAMPKAESLVQEGYLLFPSYMSFSKENKDRVERLNQNVEDVEKGIGQAIVMYGEDPKTLSAGEFFQVFASLGDEMIKASDANARRKADESRATKAVTAQKKDEGAFAGCIGKNGNQRGVLDELMTTLQSGPVSLKKVEQPKKAEQRPQQQLSAFQARLQRFGNR